MNGWNSTIILFFNYIYMNTILNEGVMHFLDNASTKELIDIIDKWAITIQEIKKYNQMKKQEEQKEKRKKKIERKMNFKLFLKKINYGN